MNNKKGFSLIELSIVLIIIGLLIAGITGGASLMKSAQLRAVMSEIRNYQTAINAYYTATGELPGTDGSSQMNFANSCTAWADLANEGVLENNFLTSRIDENGKYYCPSKDDVYSWPWVLNSPASKIKNSIYVLGYNNDMANNVIFLVRDSESYSINLTNAVAPDSDGSGGTPVSSASVTRKDAKFLDEKMDNGVIDSGKIYSFSAGIGSCSYESDDDSVQACATAISIGL